MWCSSFYWGWYLPMRSLQQDRKIAPNMFIQWGNQINECPFWLGVDVVDVSLMIQVGKDWYSIWCQEYMSIILEQIENWKFTLNSLMCATTPLSPPTVSLHSIMERSKFNVWIFFFVSQVSLSLREKESTVSMACPIMLLMFCLCSRRCLLLLKRMTFAYGVITSLQM